MKAIRDKGNNEFPLEKKNGNSVVFNRGGSIGILWDRRARSTISKTRASVSSGYPRTEKQMKARGCRPSAFIVSRCLDTPMKHEARVLKK